MNIAIWNIEKFTDARLLDQIITTDTLFGGRTTTKYDRAPLLAYMQEVFTGNNTLAFMPEVFAVLEVLVDTNLALGAPPKKGGSGANGLLELLKLIKKWTKNDSWHLVPPLKRNPVAVKGVKTAQSEVVGVFYDKSEVKFRGPYAWIAGQSQAPGAGASAAYPHPWNKADITDGTKLAGQVRYYDSTRTEITFPSLNHRRPFLVDFDELKGSQRHIRCAFMHTSPGFHIGGTQAMAEIDELSGDAVGDPDICVCGGDFNVNDYSTAVATKSYKPLYSKRYKKVLTPKVNHSTHYYPKRKAKPSNRFEYMQEELIDNFLVRYRTKTAAKKAKYSGYSIDIVYPSPAPPFIPTLQDKLSRYPKFKKGDKPGPAALFRQWENFFHIRRCSDHTAIFLTI